MPEKERKGFCDGFSGFTTSNTIQKKFSSLLNFRILQLIKAQHTMKLLLQNYLKSEISRDTNTWWLLIKILQSPYMQQNYDLKYLKWEVTRQPQWILNVHFPCSEHDQGHKKLQMFYKVLRGGPTLAGSTVLALISPMPWAQYMTVIQSHLTHCVSKMFLIILFLSLLAWGHLAHFWLAQTSHDVSFSFSDCSFSNHCGEYHNPLHWWTGTHTPPRSHFEQSPLPQSPPGVIGGCGPTGSPMAVVWSYSWPANWLLLVLWEGRALFIQLMAGQSNAGCQQWC